MPLKAMFYSRMHVALVLPCRLRQRLRRLERSRRQPFAQQASGEHRLCKALLRELLHRQALNRDIYHFVSCGSSTLTVEATWWPFPLCSNLLRQQVAMQIRPTLCYVGEELLQRELRPCTTPRSMRSRRPAAVKFAPPPCTQDDVRDDSRGNCGGYRHAPP